MNNRISGSLVLIAGAIPSLLQGNPAIARETDWLQPLDIDFMSTQSIESPEPVAMTAFSAVSLAQAQEEIAASQKSVEKDDFHFGVAFTLWLPGIDGTVGARGFTTDVSATFIDILDDSNTLFGFGGMAEYRGEKFGAYLGGYWSTIEVDIPVLTGTITNTNDIGLVTFGVLYEVGRWSVEHTAQGDLPARDMSLTLYGGARWSSVSVEFDLPILPTIERDQTWVDPMIGAKFNYPFSQHWSIMLGGDVGGFGAASDFAWSATAAISWDFRLKNLPASLQFGYLAIGDDYTTGSGTEEFVWDTILHGVMMNFVIRF